MLNRLILLLFAIFPVIHAGAADYRISGKVTDKAGIPEMYATIRAYAAADTLKAAALGVADEAGAFTLTLKQPGRYIVKVSAVGKLTAEVTAELTAKQPVGRLGTVVLKGAEKELGEVTVTAMKPLVTKEIDRIGYDVQADPESSTATVSDILRKVPLVTVEADGTVKVKGSTNFKIYKNGRPNNTLTGNAKDVLKAIPASMIKTVEVITDPGAREDAEGVAAILNIVTLENMSIKGVTGVVAANYSTDHTYPNGTLWMTTQVDKVTLSVNGGVAPGSIKVRQSNNSKTTYHDTGNTLTDEGRYSGGGFTSWWGFEGSYEPDSLNLITADFGGYFYRMHASGTSSVLMSDPAANPLYSYTTDYSRPRGQYLDFSGTLNYQHSTHRKGEALTLSYMVQTTDQREDATTEYHDITAMPMPYTSNSSAFTLNFIEHTFQADWTRPFGKMHTLDIGAKYILRHNHSLTDQSLAGYAESHSDFTHMTNVGALYADYRMKWRSLSARAGLRYEFSRLTASYADGSADDFSRNLSDFVPSASVGWQINDMSTLKASVATRISRPGISYLNPAISTEPNSTSQGNPELASGRYYIPSLNYSYTGQRLMMDFTLSYTLSDNAIVPYRYTEGDHSYSTYRNGGEVRQLSLSGYANWKLWEKTSLLLNASVGHARYSAKSPDVTNARWNASLYFRISQTLPWKLRAEASLYYSTGGIDGLYGYRTASTPYNNISLQRSFLRDDRLTFQLGVNNLIGNGRTKSSSYTDGGGYSSEFTYRIHDARSVFVRLSYRFGSLDAKVKKTASKISNDDLVGRKNK